jgi:hypothetical protein
MIEAVSASSCRAGGAAADDHSLGLFPSPRTPGAAITTTTAEEKPEQSQ